MDDQKRLGADESAELLCNPKEMSLLDHLSELRSRLIRSLIGVVGIFFVSLVFANHIINFLKRPLVAALPSGVQSLHFTGPLDVFVVNIKVAFLSAVIWGSPIWIYQFWKFVEPALYPKERRYVVPFVLSSILLFFAGISFCFVVILPVVLEFLIGMGIEVGTPIITINDYMSMLLLLIFAFGIIFETPLILILLAMMDLINAEVLSRNRKYILVGVLVLGALLTPPDPLSQLALALPTYLMFEISILIIKWIKRGQPT